MLVFRAADGRTLTLEDLRGLTAKVRYEIVGETSVPAEAEALHQQARQAGGAGDYRRALALLERASHVAPQWPYPVYDMAFTYLLLKDVASARQHYRKTIELAPRRFFTALTALDALDREASGELPPGTYLAYMSLEWLDDPGKKADAIRQLVERVPTFCARVEGAGPANGLRSRQTRGPGARPCRQPGRRDEGHSADQQAPGSPSQRGPRRAPFASWASWPSIRLRPTAPSIWPRSRWRISSRNNRARIAGGLGNLPWSRESTVPREPASAGIWGWPTSRLHLPAAGGILGPESSSPQVMPCVRTSLIDVRHSSRRAWAPFRWARPAWFWAPTSSTWAARPCGPRSRASSSCFAAVPATSIPGT